MSSDVKYILMNTLMYSWEGLIKMAVRNPCIFTVFGFKTCLLFRRLNVLTISIFVSTKDSY